jgi:diguanylate cyclase (GGDEF)-like protein
MHTTVTTPEVAELNATIDALRAEIASLERTIDELHGELHCRDIDELTGMHNLRWLREFWSSLHQPSAAIGAVAFIDIDMLKRVNDTYGHKTGDRVITHVAAVLIASGCYGVRYGGDEFLLLVPAGWDVQTTITQIVGNLAADPIPTRDETITVAASCGVRRVAEGDRDLYQLIHDADSVMYEVKRARSGGFRIVG